MVTFFGLGINRHRLNWMVKNGSHNTKVKLKLHHLYSYPTELSTRNISTWNGYSTCSQPLVLRLTFNILLCSASAQLVMNFQFCISPSSTFGWIINYCTHAYPTAASSLSSFCNRNITYYSRKLSGGNSGVQNILGLFLE